MFKRFPAFEAIPCSLDVWPGEVLGRSEVNEFDLMLVVEEDVLGFEVSVHNLVFVMDYWNGFEEMAYVVFELWLANDPVEFRLVPNLAVGWAIHLQKEMNFVLEGLPQANHILTVFEFGEAMLLHEEISLLA